MTVVGHVDSGDDHLTNVHALAMVPRGPHADVSGELGLVGYQRPPHVGTIQRTMAAEYQPSTPLMRTRLLPIFG
jgi:hypothetical protein